ncbi:unnamed protein product, partial [Owenia fusiformis]
KMATPRNQLVAAGFIIFRRLQAEVQYLFLQTSYGEHHWTPPKGHVDPGESEMETALRETHEEAGLSKEQFTIVDNFKDELLYEVRGKPKRVVYWIAELKNPETPIKLSDEHIKYDWVNYANVNNYAQWDDMKLTMKRVHQFINEKLLVSN